MPYYDITAGFILRTPITVPTLHEHLIAALRSLQVETKVEKDIVEFRVPLIMTITRGFALQGASFGQIELEIVDNGCGVKYKIATVPMRLFCVVLALISTILIPFTYFGRLNLSLSALLFPAFGGLLMSVFGYLAGRAIVSWKFRRFVSIVANTLE